MSYPSINAILADPSVLSPEDAARLSAILRSPMARRSQRLSKRDALIRRAFGMLTGSKRATATELARLIDQHVEGKTKRTETPDELHAMVTRIVEANEGRSIGWRQLLNVREGDRTPDAPRLPD